MQVMEEGRQSLSSQGTWGGSRESGSGAGWCGHRGNDTLPNPARRSWWRT